MRLFVNILVVSFYHVIANGQIALTGTILEDSLNTPLENVSVNIKGTNQGTLTNKFGEFRLTTEVDNPMLIISSMGYQTIEVKPHNNDTFKVKAIPIRLNEVVVNGKVSGIILKCYDAIQLQRNETHFGKVFFRQTTELNNEVITELVESIMDVKMTGKEIKQVDKKFQVRQAKDRGEFIEVTNNLIYILKFKPWINTNEQKNAIISSDFMNTYNGELIGELDGNYVIKVYPKIEGILKEATLIISMEDFQLKEFEQRLRLPNQTYKENFSAQDINLVLTNKFTGDRHLPSASLLKITSVLKIGGIEKKQVTTSKLIFYDYPSTLKRVTWLNSDDFEFDYSLLKSSRYKSRFWKNNPIIKLTPLENKAVEFFEEKGLMRSK